MAGFEFNTSVMCLRFMGAEELLSRAKGDFQLEESMLRSMSGADQADSEYFRLRRLFWLALRDGVPHAEARANLIAAWRAYAEGQQKKVDAAPKIRRGPMSGHSAISHRWVSPEKAEADIDVLQARLHSRAPERLVRIDTLKKGQRFVDISGRVWVYERVDGALSGVHHVEGAGGFKTSFAGCAEVEVLP